MRRAAGYTVLEMMVTIFILGFVVLGVFGLFSIGSNGFRHTILRQGIQGDAARVASALRRDVRLTHLDSVTVEARNYTTADGRAVRRDGLAFVSLSNWNDPNRFYTVTRLPRWDRYIVFYATNDRDLGRLVRQEIEPGGEIGPYPYLALPGNLAPAPVLNADVVETTILAENVLSFSARPNPATRTVEVALSLRQISGKLTGGQRKVDEIMELEFDFEPRNTFPKL